MAGIGNDLQQTHVATPRQDLLYPVLLRITGRSRILRWLISKKGNTGVIAGTIVNVEIEGDVEVEEEDDGDLRVTLNGSSIGDDLKLSEEDEGAGTFNLRGTTVGDELDFNNVVEIWRESIR